ncbi:MAG TPA: peptidoglycan-binding domain-containing protein [Thermohalobaculum sp.]|nr:peptidoglycan-binding domain-containing protein [Thermohalobaculum sp.]
MPAKAKRASSAGHAGKAGHAGHAGHAGRAGTAGHAGHAGQAGHAGHAPSAAWATAAAAIIPAGGPTGDDILDLALTHKGEKYVFGARAPMANAAWKGPWDCAEFCSWCVFQVAGTLYGVRPSHDPVRADAFTGYWGEDAAARGVAIAVEDALRTPGACLLRVPQSGRTGHIAFSDGKGGTMEAHSTARGVIAHTAQGRRWDMGVLIPGVRYFAEEDFVPLEPAPPVLRLTDPMMRGPRIKKAQEALAALGYSVGTVDGIFGSQTEAAVLEFQIDRDQVPDGEIGKDTAELLGIA